MTGPEFSRPLTLDEIGEPAEHSIDANAAECAAVARRFDLRALDALAARFSVAAVTGGVRVTGKVSARAVQACVTSGEDVAASIDEPVDLLVLRNAARDPEIELEAGDCDVVPLEGRAVDLGEIAAQTLGLALDPYPRADPAKLEAARKLLISEDDARRRAEEVKAKANPFAALRRDD